jgi:ABC-type polysaccharide transport system permease subunit
VLFAFAIPVVYNLVLSFEQTSPATVSHLTAPFAGWSNYTTTLRDPVADSAIVRTFSFTVLSLLFQFLIGFGLALLFSLRFPLSRFARSLVLVPWLLPLLVTGVIFKFLFQLQAGAVNQVLLDLHLVHQPVGFEVAPGWAYLTVLITNVWIGVPFFTVLLYSALQDVPPELLEAAPRMNATCERLIGTLHREVLDRMLILGERHLRAILTEYQVHYNTARPHQGIAQRVPDEEPDAARATLTDIDRQQIRRKPVLGGLINEYTHAA